MHYRFGMIKSNAKMLLGEEIGWKQNGNRKTDIKKMDRGGCCQSV